MTSAITVVRIRDQAQLSALAPEWWELWQRGLNATPFQTPAWLIAWWKAFRPGELTAIAVRFGTRLIGLAPFYLERSSDHCVRLLPIGISISDYHDVLVDEDLKQPALAAIAKAYGQLDIWDEWDCPELPPGAATFDLPIPIGCRAAESIETPCPVLMLPESVEALHSRLSARKRRNLCLLCNRLEHHGRAEIITIRQRPTEWWLTQLWRLHGARWTSRGETGVLADERLRGFHGEVVPELAARGLLRFYALALGDDIAGIYYGLHQDGCAYGYLTGFDPAYAYYSPGTFLVGHAIEEAIHEGASEFHFLRGDEAYKYTWGAQDRWNMRRIIRRCRDE